MRSAYSIEILSLIHFDSGVGASLACLFLLLLLPRLVDWLALWTLLLPGNVAALVLGLIRRRLWGLFLLCLDLGFLRPLHWLYFSEDAFFDLFLEHYFSQLFELWPGEEFFEDGTSLKIDLQCSRL